MRTVKPGSASFEIGAGGAPLSADALARMRTPLIIDGRNLLDPETVRAAGFTYEGVGRAVGPAVSA